MAALSYALVTPSFRLDVDRCALLIESVERWVAPHVVHYLIVDRRDVQLFKPLATSRTRLLVVEEIVPNWLIRIPGIRRFWLSLRTRPVKNWILQQIVKLSLPAAVNDDVLLYTDSDVFFIAPFDPVLFERNGNVPLFVETGQRGKIERNDEWQRVASRLLDLPVEADCDTNYIGNVICWRRENVLSMHRRIESLMGKKWEMAIAPQTAFSEYILYGLFANRVLGERSGHWHDSEIRTLNYWQTAPLDLEALRRYRAQLKPQHHSVMISAKSRTPTDSIRKVFF